jgi:hypothetical protein
MLQIASAYPRYSPYAFRGAVTVTVRINGQYREVEAIGSVLNGRAVIDLYLYDGMDIDPSILSEADQRNARTALWAESQQVMRRVA